MDAFFASVETLIRPELKGKPVVVGGRGNPHQRGVVSTCSYEARRYGIHSAMPLRVAYRLCPEAVFLPVNIDLYRRVSKRIFSILREYTPIIEPLGIDEAFLDITDAKRDALQIAKEIKQRIKEEIGLTASVGIAHNKLLAKIASGLNKPNGLTLVEGEVDEFLKDLPVSVIPGIGPKTEARLYKLGVRKVGELRNLPLNILVSHFGKVFGNNLYRYSRGIDDSPVITHREPKSKSREVTFLQDVRDISLIKKTIRELVKDLFSDLRAHLPRTVGLKIRYQDFSTHTRSHTFKRPQDSLEQTLPILFSLLDRFHPHRKIRLIGVKFSNLEKIRG